jgi:hypothetical protein
MTTQAERTRKRYPGMFEWLFAFYENAIRDHEFTPDQVQTAKAHYEAGIDPWESLAAICEGRKLRIRKAKT